MSSYATEILNIHVLYHAVAYDLDDKVMLRYDVAAPYGSAGQARVKNLMRKYIKESEMLRPQFGRVEVKPVFKDGDLVKIAVTPKQKFPDVM